MLSLGRRTVRPHRFGEKGSEVGGGAGTSCSSISLETDCIKQTPNGQAEHWLPGRVRVRHMFPGPGFLLMVDNGTMM